MEAMQPDPNRRDGVHARQPGRALSRERRLCAGALLIFLALGQGVAAMGVAERENALPAGSVVYLRLEGPVSTKASHLRQPVSARVVRDVFLPSADRPVLIPVGATLRGTVDKLIPSSSPADRPKLRLEFTQLELPGGSSVPIAGRITEVENARESVLADGAVQGLLPSELPVTMIEGALDKLKKSSPGMGDQAQKAEENAMGKGDTSIELPAGTDFTLTLDQPLVLQQVFAPAASDQLTSAAGEAIARLLEDAPQRAEGKDGKPGDPLNLVIVGTQEQIRQAFEKAGWAEAEKLTGKSLFETMRAVMANKGYGSAPVSQLYLFGRAEDLAFQKMLNTFAKRHHLRIWKSPVQTSDGRDVWLSAATHDTGWDIRPGVVSHAIDPEIDRERDKVAADLIATGLVASARPVARPNPLAEGLTATGATWKTDGRLFALELK